MYGTIARFRVKSGMLEKLIEMSKSDDMTNIAGHVGTIVYQMDADSSEFYMAVAFADKEAYFKNANDPEQDQRYREFVALLEGDPEWHDGEIVYNFTK